jgi:hypothetical protein
VTLRLVRWLLHLERRRLEDQITPAHFDAALSRRIDAVPVALEALT